MLDGSLETAAPSRALAGAHTRKSGAAAMKMSGKDLGHASGIYLLVTLLLLRVLWAQQR